MQTILMMAEIGGYCFWKCDYPNKDYLKHTALSTEDLPLSFELNNQITEWEEFYEEYFDPLVVLSIAKRKVYKDNFDAVGKLLWQLVKEELKDNYKVVYYSEVENKVLED